MSATVTYQYVYFGYTGAHQRRPRLNPLGGFVSLNLQVGTETLLPDSPFSVSTVSLPSTLPGGYTFAFVNVSGLREGGLMSTDVNSPPHGTAGDSPINVLVVYMPPGGPGGNGNDWGAVIDAFDETTGTLVSDLFITANPDNGQTNNGNIEGFVDTTNSAEAITAYHHITDSDAYFNRWVDLSNPNNIIIGSTLNVAKKTTVYALAFYRNPKIVKIIKDKEFIKDHIKDTIKDIIKENFKENKDIHDKVKLSPEIIFGPGPVEISEVTNLIDRISKIEAGLNEVIKGMAFIKKEDRPAVGKDITKGRSKS